VRDFLEIGLGDRDALTDNHRVGALPGIARQHAQNRADGNRNDDDRDDELDERHAALALRSRSHGVST
jgi:hypothetical protein